MLFLTELGDMLSLVSLTQVYWSFLFPPALMGFWLCCKSIHIINLFSSPCYFQQLYYIYTPPLVFHKFHLSNIKQAVSLQGKKTRKQTKWTHDKSNFYILIAGYYHHSNKNVLNWAVLKQEHSFVSDNQNMIPNVEKVKDTKCRKVHRAKGKKARMQQSLLSKVNMILAEVRTVKMQNTTLQRTPSSSPKPVLYHTGKQIILQQSSLYAFSE